MNLPYPVIVVPGITASNLQDEYLIDPETVWSVLKKDYERIALHPNDLRYEAIEPARVRQGKLFEIAYNELINELRYNLKDKEDEPVPVYPFGYDWRMPLETVQKQLDDFITEVIERTKLLKHYYNQGYENDAKVNLVGHSMGGLVITGYLESKGQASPVDKVVTLATPFQGSFEAVIKIVTGTANLGVSPPSSREREAARITPGLYHLLPSFKNGVTTTEPDLPTSFFDPEIWQDSVYLSLEEFIRLKGRSSEDIEKQAEELLNELLKKASDHRDKTDSFNLSNAGLDKSKWLAVAGIGTDTRVKINITKIGDSPHFDLKSDDRKNDWENDKSSRLTGDGTVPFEGAIPKFLKVENLVCVTPDDYGYWEIEDRLVTKVAGFHGILPNMDMLHRLIVRFFRNKDDPKGNTWGRPAPGIAKENWDPPLQFKD
jgi:pimeloyl-ACP methyl ester carboxylesterase